MGNYYNDILKCDKYKISITSCYDYRIPIEKQIKSVADAGFSCFSLGADAEHSGIFDCERLKSLKELLDNRQLKVDTVHFSYNLDDDDWENKMKDTMRATKYLKAPIIVVHCTPFEIDKEYYNKTLAELSKRISLLEKMCFEYNVKAALENLAPGYATMTVEELLTISNPDVIGFCYDSSHDQIDGPRPMKLLEDWKHRLMAIHISDRIKSFTDHVLPGEGFVKFEEMIQIMKTAKIDFPFLMEVETTHSKYKQEDEFLKNAYSEAYKLMKGIKN